MARAAVIASVSVAFAVALAAPPSAQQAAPATQRQAPPPPAPLGIAYPPLGEGPFVFKTAEQQTIRVVVITRQLANPWSLAFLPDGNILITERAGRLRIIRDGVLDPRPVEGVPEVKALRLAGLEEVSLHPRFAENHWVYLTYTKPRDDGLMATVLARGTWNGGWLADVRDLLVVTPWWDANGGAASRLAWGRDGMLYMTTGASLSDMMMAQDTSILKGKVLRLRDDGTAPPDNPFVGRAGSRPEIFSLGHRNQLGLAIHPRTGAVWTSEQGPNGGDEINIIRAGANYGWPIVSLGNKYGSGFQGVFSKEGFEDPVVAWIPSIAASGLAFYTGDRFPVWKGNVFVGSMRVGEIPGTGRLERVVFNNRDEQIRRESLLTELHQRIRDVRQGSDGLLYLLTEENPGALLRIEPVP